MKHLYLKTGRSFLSLLTLGLIAGTLVFIPAQAQNEQPHHEGKTSSTKTARGKKRRPRPKNQVYVCPMHSDVKAKSAGRCPKCGMDLRAVRHDEAGVNSSEVESPVAKLQSARTAETPEGELSKMNIPDTELLDQDGRKIHFYTDLVKGRTVAINFIFTTCTTICPPLGATFARVQKEMGDKVGRDVRFISISVDPATDTPERLKAWGAKFHAGDGWTLVTGDKPQVDELLRALGASAAQREDHTPTVLIGNDAHGSWTRTYGLARASQLVQIINDAMVGKIANTTVGTSN